MTSCSVTPRGHVAGSDDDQASVVSVLVRVGSTLGTELTMQMVLVMRLWRETPLRVILQRLLRT